MAKAYSMQNMFNFKIKDYGKIVICRFFVRGYLYRLQ